MPKEGKYKRFDMPYPLCPKNLPSRLSLSAWHLHISDIANRPQL